MDNCPEVYAPFNSGNAFRMEPFQAWWRRIGREGYPTVPRNVARQWIHRHWSGGSPYRGLSLAGLTWSLEELEANYLLNTVSVVGDTAQSYVEWGEYLLTEYLHNHWYGVAGAMLRRGVWPAPIIVLDQRSAKLDQNIGLPLDGDMILIEGNRRLAIARALRERGKLQGKLPVWLASPSEPF
ncbi:MAG TPA: hypothetical protein VM661_06875 [Candidatus Sulfotelmatobacter sp.]|jgi:hypothetical protein|nr:hypothetical protein [Candidatus Sulfotelmatobacter sp.]